MKRISLALLFLILAILACARSKPVSTPTTDTTRTINFGGMERTYILHVPPSYDGKPVPLVMVFHGGGGNAENAVKMTNFNAFSDNKGFIVAYPSGTGRLEDKILTWNSGTCCGFAQANNVDDVGFVRTMIADIQTIAAIDSKRIYATGMSNGGIISYRLACEASDLIAAIGSVSGTQNITPCNPQSPISVIDFHGTADQHLPYNGGIGDKSLAGTDFVSVQDSIQFWVKEDQCSSTPATQKYADIQQDTYSNCANGTTVELYTIINGLHAWPGSDGPGWIGGDLPTQSISATQLIWDFFASHPKP